MSKKKPIDLEPCGAADLPKEDYLADGLDAGLNDIRAVVLEIFTRDGVKYHRRICKECGGVFEAKAAERRDFGSQAHRLKFLQRRQRRGLMIINDVLRMRKNRKDRDAFSDVCRKVSMMLDQDRAAGRPSW